jgi:hypothetical protein
MVSKQKRQQYNRRYYSKKTMDRLKAIDTIEEINETETEEDEPLLVINVDDIKHIHEYEPHILMRLFFRVFYIIRFKFITWFKP